MKYVIGIDLGTSAVKILLINQAGEVCQEVSKTYPLIQPQFGYNEQDPTEWVAKTTEGLAELVQGFSGDPKDIEGISFSGQMHGLVLLDKNNQVLRNAILWNDTRTTEQCQQIYETIGKERLLKVAKNPALEGFTLPKILWVKQNEPKIFDETNVFVMPKDYVRYCMTDQIHTEYSDAAGTLLLNIEEKAWSKELCEKLALPINMCPPLVDSDHFVGTITPAFAKATGLAESVKVFAGGADNACGAIGAGVLTEGNTLCSIGTSGVVLSHEERNDQDYQGKVHFFNHGKSNAFYSMGVTLAAGYSLSWFKDTFAETEDFEQLLNGIENVSIGANGLLFTPYLVGERTPHADSNIRGSFIGMDASHKRLDFVRAVLEGITFSLHESIEIFRENGKVIDSIISIGGGAKNEVWLQMQADIFNATIIKLASEQGPAMGAAILAAYGCGWYETLEDCANHYIKPSKMYDPIKENVEKYQSLFTLYKKVYKQTRTLNEELHALRNIKN